MQKAISKVNTLLEALPYIREFNGKTFVIKFGGNALIESSLNHSFALDIILLNYVGIKPVIVHGGGPQIGDLLNRLGKKSEFVNGLRVTDKETMDAVEMVLVGKINKEIVSRINQHGGRAVGLSGKDGNLITARKLFVTDPNNAQKKVDIGMVGQVDKINSAVITSLENSQFIVVIAPLGVDEHGQTYNINADTVAGEIAAELNAEKLILLTDVEGVKDGEGKIFSSLSIAQTAELIKNGDIKGGMIPKVECCRKAIENGVSKAHIIDGRVEHAVLLEIFTDHGIGTQIVKDTNR